MKVNAFLGSQRGAQWSERGKAAYTRTRTEGEGPQPLGTNRTKVLSERASCTWVDSYGAEEMRRNAPGIARRLTKESRMR